MRLVREAALSRLTAPDYLTIHGEELRVLRQLPAWVRWLFAELVVCSNFATGKGTTSRARLLALLDFDQAPSGPKPEGCAITTKRLRAALDSLQAAGLVTVDPFRNVQSKTLFFEVQPRTRRGVPAEEQGRQSGREQGRPPQGENASADNTLGAASQANRADNRAENRAGGTREEDSTRASPVDNLSTPPPGAREKLRAARDRIAGGR